MRKLTIFTTPIVVKVSDSSDTKIHLPMRPQNVTERPMSGKLRIIVSFCACMLILVLAGAYTFINTHRYSETTGWVTHSQRLIAESRTLLTLAQDLESSKRGFIITNQDHYLDSHKRAISDLDSIMSLIQELIKDNPTQQQLLKQIDRSFAEKIAFTDNVILIRRTKGIEAASRFLGSEKGAAYMQAIRTKLFTFAKTEERLLNSRLETANKQFGAVIRVIIGFVVLALAMLLGTLYAFIKDYNARLKVQRQLSESEGRIKSMLESLPVGIFIIDDKGVPYFANEESTRILGEGILPGKNVADLPVIYPTFMIGTNDTFPIEQLPIARALGGETVFGEERLEIERPNGERRLLRVSARPLRNSLGEIEYAIASFEDITEAKLAEKELILTRRRAQEGERRLRDILEALPVGVFILDQSGKPYYSNESSRKILGDIVDNYEFKEKPESYSRVKADTDEIYPTSELAAIKALRGEITFGDESMELKYESGRRVPLRISANPLRDSEGNIEYAITVFEDITEIKKGEKELRAAKRQAEEALVLKETFLANMSHEIRTPMNAILGFTDLLLKKQIEDEAREYVGIIRTSGENLLRIINDILDISKIEAKMMVFEEHPLSIHDLFKSLSNMLSHRANEKKLTLSFLPSTDIPETLVGDPTRLTQIIVNLVGNAIKFTRKGSVTVMAKVVDDEADACLLQFSVTDTGIGIPADKLNHIFERFQQAEDYTARNYGGTGLGLSIARQLVELQGGEMTIESEVDKGSTFSFTLRLKKTKQSKAAKSKQVEHFGNFDYIRKLRILMAEDNPINVKLVLTLFGEQNIKVDVAENGKQAIEMIREKQYDLILMDLEMPVMNGYEATTFIRKEMQLQVPIIAMTAHAMAGEQEKCYQLGMNEFISKPINVNQLYEKMYQVTSNGEAATVVASEPVVTVHKPVESIVSEVVTSPVTQAVAQDVVDLSYLRELSGGNQPFELEMIELFVQQMPEDVTSLKVAFESKDFPGIKASAHKMKSSVAVVGAKYLLEHLAALEKDGEAQNMTDDTVFHFESVLSQLEDCYKALDNIVKTEYTS